MHGLSPTDPGRSIDWNCTSADYARYRPGYPESFWTRLTALGLGLPGQRILDLGTGTGVLAREFAQRGCAVWGVDVAADQVAAGLALARQQGVYVELSVASAEHTGLPDASFDAVTASQCWLYFDPTRAILEARRLLAPGGVLMTCHLSWLPQEDVIARRTEELVLRYNPQWTAADWHGRVPAMPDWAQDHFALAAMFVYDEALPFSRETWRGRIRACRGIGASLPADQVQAFDLDLDALLGRIAGDSFTVRHRIDAHLLRPIDTSFPCPGARAST